MNSNTNNGTNVVKKTTLGRRKIEIKKINNVNSRQVTFSKRRVGLFKKASELCILTGAQVAIIIHSPGNHVFSFGHPNVESLIRRYTDDISIVSHNPTSSSSSSVNALLHKQRYAAVKKELEAEKKREKISNWVKPELNNGKFWWNERIDELEAVELEQYMEAAMELKKNVLMKADQLLFMEKSAAGGVPFAGSINANMTAVSGNYGNYNLNYGADEYTLPFGLGLEKGQI